MMEEENFDMNPEIKKYIVKKLKEEKECVLPHLGTLYTDFYFEGNERKVAYLRLVPEKSIKDMMGPDENILFSPDSELIRLLEE